MTKFVFHGEGHTVGDGGPPLLLIIILAMLCSTGAAAALAMALAMAVVVLLAVAVVVSGALVAFLFYRLRHPQAVLPGVRPYVVHQLAPEPERPAIAPREFHFHYHGADPREAAEILRSAREGQ